MRGESLLRCVRRIRQGGCRRYHDSHYGSESRTAKRRTAPIALALVSQYLVVGKRLPAPFSASSDLRPRKRMHGAATLAVRKTLAIERRSTRIAIHGKRNELRAPVWRGKSLLREGRVPCLRDSRRPGRRKSRAHGHENGGALSLGAGSRRIGDAEAAVNRHGTSRGDGRDLALGGDDKRARTFGARRRRAGH